MGALATPRVIAGNISDLYGASGEKWNPAGRLPRLAQHYARQTINAAGRAEDTLTVRLQTLRIGDLAVCGIPFEAFVEMGLDLKARSPFPQTMVVGLANGRHGYHKRSMIFIVAHL
jgi:hypothetical protein